MRHTIDTARVRNQLQNELNAVREFEHNVRTLLDAMHEPNPYADCVAEARTIRFNQQCSAQHLARASAVLELLGVCNEDDINTGDDLEGFIQTLE